MGNMVRVNVSAEVMLGPKHLRGGMREMARLFTRLWGKLQTHYHNVTISLLFIIVGVFLYLFLRLYG